MIRAQRFPVTLVFPPQGHFTQPYLALPCIKAYLEANGFDDVELVDANIEAYDRFLSAEYLRHAKSRAQERLPLERFSKPAALPFHDLGAFRAAAESAASADALIAGIEDAKNVLKSERFFDADQYVPAVRTIYHALRLVSAAHHPAVLTPHNFTMGYSLERSSEVLAATRDAGQNPFLEHFQKDLLPRLVARKPRVVGISIIYGSQLVPGLTLGRLIKQALPDCHVTAGGGFLAYIGEKLMNAPGIDECLDSLVFHEGEAPLLGLCQALRDGTPLAEIGSLTWIDSSKRAVANPSGHPIALDKAPVPNFDGLPFEKYLAPELVLPFDINRGCYYGECTFCTLPTVIGPGYRTRRAQTIVEQVLALKSRYHSRNFNFITDCMPPGMIKDLPEELIAREAGIRWWADARVEPKAYNAEGAKKLYESGCRKLLFGFETATPRLLKMMMKGQSLKSTVEVATNCAQAGISVTFYAMVGFPSETREEAQATVDFLVEHSDVVREVSLQTFHIDEVAQVYKRPEDFGVRILDDPTADIELYHDYESSQGMTQEEAAEMFEAMMTALRRHFPIFSGDNILYFMQKSHYFLHLAHDTKPDDFVARCAERTAKREARGAEHTLAPNAKLSFVELSFGYTEALARLAHPLARMVRPDFLTGRYVAGAEEEAERRLGSLARKHSVLCYDPASAEFVELRPDGKRVLELIAQKGSLGALLEGIDPGDLPAIENVKRFAAELHRMGVLRASV
ncbi:MAG: radical SAM protein [Planctomycetes bacterium]|nr:radical SAM protein [Planctomycetota bacterium]